MSQHESFQDPEAVPELTAMVQRALSSLIAQTAKTCDRPEPSGQLFDADVDGRLITAVTDPNHDAFNQAADRLNALGVCDHTIANRHVPTIARALGASWVEGSLDFSTVSIGCSRLQGFLRRRALNGSCASHTVPRPVARVLLIVPDFEQHTLGAILLAGQLRAAAVDVDLVLHKSVAAIQDQARSETYDGILISSSQSETIGALHRVILALRAIPACATIVLGGNILDQISNVRSETGADFTANCWQDVLGVITSKSRFEEAGLVGLLS